MPYNPPMLRYETAGESHGRCLLALISGLPFGAPLSVDPINAELSRRQGGYGRGPRNSKGMEQDVVEILTGIRSGLTIGSPVVLQVANRVCNIEELPAIPLPRPGHADLAGARKYGIDDARPVAERSSARETAARVAAGALAASLLASFGIRLLGHVVSIGEIEAPSIPGLPTDELRKRRNASPFYTLDPAKDEAFRERVDRATQDCDTLGGIVEVIASGLPPGLGTHVQGPDRLDARIARALMGIPSVKGVEIGLGFEAARRPGSEVHDAMGTDGGKIVRHSNHAGGIEGGMTNGEPLVARAACKPIPTLRRGLPTVDLRSGEETTAKYERSDICAIPAASVIAESAVAFELLSVFLDRFGGDTWEETERRFRALSS